MKGAREEGHELWSKKWEELSLNGERRASGGKIGPGSQVLKEEVE